MEADASEASDTAVACISQSAGMADADMLEKEEESPVFPSNAASVGVFVD